MKKHLFYYLFLALPYPLLANSIEGPSRVCPGQTVTFRWNPSFDYTNCWAPPQWNLYQNGENVMGYSHPSSNPSDWENKWTFVWPFETVPGTARIEVKGLECCWLCDEEDYLNVTVGLGQPTNILGPDNICPNSTSTFNLAPVDYATSYTWTVPNGWKVNGISGPVVIGQSNTVQISSPTTGFGNYNIKVNAVSPSCGTSAQTTRPQKLDYPIELFAGPPNDYAEFTVMPNDQNSYTWILPSTWRKIWQEYNEIVCDTRGNAGTILVHVVTLCNNTLAAQKYFDPNASFNTVSANEVGVYPNPVSSELMINDLIENSSVIILNNSGKVVKEVQIDETNKKIDISDLTPGTYYLKYWNNNKEIVKRIKKE